MAYGRWVPPAPAASAPTREDLVIPSGTDELAAWLYRPAGIQAPPLLVMAHGLGGTRRMRLDAFAERFAAAGYAALVFDYRHFGDSTGEPRRLLDIGLQHEDWAAALAFARALPGVDHARIVLWGTSFSGGHVLEVAARDARLHRSPPIAAVISQCPFTSGPASLRCSSAASLAKVTRLAVRDVMRRGEPPRVMVDLVGPPGSAALMTAPDALPGYRAIVPAGLEGEGDVVASFALKVGFYRPGRAAADVGVPVLFVLCDHDSVAPSRTAERFAVHAPRAEIRHHLVGHFDIYMGEPFERVVGDELEFLGRHLLPGR